MAVLKWHPGLLTGRKEDHELESQVSVVLADGIMLTRELYQMQSHRPSQTKIKTLHYTRPRDINYHILDALRLGGHGSLTER